MHEKPLEGIAFGFTDNSGITVHDPNVAGLKTGVIAADQALCEYVRHLGGTIYENTEDCRIDYRLNNDDGRDRGRAFGRYLLSQVSGLPRMHEVAFEKLEQEHVDMLKEDVNRGNPRVFAYQNRDRGHAKYLIETSEQIDSIVQLGKEFVRTTGQPLYENFVIRPFIKTPSDYFTSYRVTVTATGQVQAAGLLYSGHAKTDARRMINTCQDKGDQYLRFMTKYFENPDSPYFLNAKDVRSNIICGGKMIALMGNHRQALAPGEADILEAHGIDPIDPCVPTDIAKAASTIGREVAPCIDLVLGIDFIQNCQDERYLLEVNSGPTGRAYNVCHMSGKADMNIAMAVARREAVGHIAISLGTKG